MRNEPARPNRRDNRGFSALEIALACVILALGLLPVFGMMTAGTRHSSFSEYTLFAAARAKRIAEAFLTYDYRYFDSLADASELDISQVIDAGETSLPREYLAKLDKDGWREQATFEHLENGLGVLTVTLEWRFPADGRELADKPHRFVMKRLVGRRDLSMVTQLEWANQPVQS